MLSQHPSLSGRVESFLPVLAESARAKHYPQYLGYLESVMKQVSNHGLEALEGGGGGRWDLSYTAMVVQ